MRSDEPHEGYLAKASGGIGITHASDFDTMVETADNRCAEAVDAIIGSLGPAQRCAVHHHHLAAVYLYPRGGLDAAYDLARMSVGRGLDQRGIV